MNPSLFPPYDPNSLYRGALWPSGGTELAYRTTQIETALRADSVPMIDEAIALGWITPESRCFDGSTVVRYARYRVARRVAEHLLALGWPESRQVAAPAVPLSNYAPTSTPPEPAEPEDW